MAPGTWLTPVGTTAQAISEVPSTSATNASATSRSGWAGSTSSPIPAGRSPLPSPARDSAVVGFQVTINIAAATQVYLRYDGGVGSTDNHAVNLGVRFSW
jgi:uncharacterized protein with beta-barrel porin domain